MNLYLWITSGVLGKIGVGGKLVYAKTNKVPGEAGISSIRIIPIGVKPCALHNGYQAIPKPSTSSGGVLRLELPPIEW